MTLELMERKKGMKGMKNQCQQRDLVSPTPPKSILLFFLSSRLGGLCVSLRRAAGFLETLFVLVGLLGLLSCIQPMSSKDLPCKSNRDCIDFPCLNGYCGGHIVQDASETRIEPERERSVVDKNGEHEVSRAEKSTQKEREAVLTDRAAPPEVKREASPRSEPAHDRAVVPDTEPIREQLPEPAHESQPELDRPRWACSKVCPQGQACCRGKCIDTQSDAKNCGTCGKACMNRELCAGGSCMKSLPQEVLIKAGTFMMGSPTNEPGRFSNEGPRHQVKLTHDFWMWKHEVTQGEFKQYLGYNPAYFNSCGSNCPVEMVDWHEGRRFAMRCQRRRGWGSVFSVQGAGKV